jgi:hypothetical protein
MLMIGLVFSRLHLYFRKTKHSNLIWGQLTCVSISFLLFIYTFVSDRAHEKKFGNFEYNRGNRDNTFFEADKSYQIKAFAALESNFEDKNSFRITDLFSESFDTIANSIPSKVHISWFEYYRSNDPNKVLCAKYYVLNGNLINAYINDDAKENLDYKQRKLYKTNLERIVDSLTH